MTYADAFNLRTTNVSFNSVADAIDGSFGRSWGGATAGTSTAYTCSASPAWTAYDSGSVISILPHTANTGATTLNVNGLGVKTIVFKNRALMGGELVPSIAATLVYNGTNFELLNNGGGAVNWTPTVTGVGTLVLTSYTVNTARFVNHGEYIYIELIISPIVVASGSDLDINITLPPGYTSFGSSLLLGQINNGAGWRIGWATVGTSIRGSDPSLSSWSAGSGRALFVTGRAGRA